MGRRYGKPKRYRRIDDIIRPSSQAWSMPGRSDPKVHSHNTIINIFKSTLVADPLLFDCSIVPFRSPGPAQYSAKRSFTLPDMPSYTLRARFSDPADKANAFGPGPAAYSIDTGMVKHKAPHYSLAGRLDEKFRNRRLGPGPAAYNTAAHSGHLKRAAAYSMKGRHNMRSHQAYVPGPGSYNINKTTFRKGPLLGIKLKALGGMGPNPGPADYNPHKDSIMHAAPRFTFRMRTKGIGSDSRYTPGPAHYGPPIVPPIR